jgi:hypothetical protein
MIADLIDAGRFATEAVTDHFAERHWRLDLEAKGGAVRRSGKSTAALFRHHEIIGHRIVDDTRDGLALDHYRRHYRKKRQAGRKISGAIDRIDDNGNVGPRKGLEQIRIGRHRFLADEQRIGRQLAHAGVDQALRQFIGFGNEVGRIALHPHHIRRQPSEA